MALHTVEDWLCYMSGLFDQDGNLLSFRPTSRPVALATYDIRFIESVTQTIMHGKGLTDKQVELAVRVITKYRRQWEKIGLDPSYLLTEEIPLRMPLREIDRTSRIWIYEKRMYIKFPYNQKLINAMHAAMEHSCGYWDFDREEKTWSIDLVEGNIALLVGLSGFADINWGFDGESNDLIGKALLLKDDTSILPSMEYVNGEMRLINVIEDAVNSMVEHGWRPDANPIKGGMLARRHGISLAPSMLERFSSSPSLLRLIDSERDDTDHTIGTDDLISIMESLSDVTFAFVYDKNRLHMMQAKTEALENDKIFLTPNIIDAINSQVDVRNTVVVFDWPYTAHMSAALKGMVLGTLNMIPDDEKRNARL